MNNTTTLDEFRKIISQAMIEKGVEPPAYGSDKEKKLYQQWLAGKEKLKGTNLGN